MSIYEDAIADIKKIQEIATDNAQRAILDAVTPRIRELIENQLFSEQDDDDGAPGAPEPEGELLTDDGSPMPVVEPLPAAAVDAVSPPDEEGKVTLDIDDLRIGDPTAPAGAQDPTQDEYELSLESIDALTVASRGSGFGTLIERMGRRIRSLTDTVRTLDEASARKQIAEMISRVEDMYEHIQSRSTVDRETKDFEGRLEAYYNTLNKLQESMMAKTLNEEDVTLKLTGLPDDIDLESVGVDLITGEGDDAGAGEGDAGEGDDVDIDFGDEEGDEEGGDEGAGADDDELGEANELSDDTIVEIDESMLRNEIRRMRRIREEAVPSTDGNGVDAGAIDDFADATDEGDPLDQDVTCCDASSVRSEAFEKRFRERAKARAVKLQAEARKARRARNRQAESRARRGYEHVKKQFNESLKRSKRLAESARSRNLPSRNGGGRPAENKVVSTLRAKLSSSNLNNAKLAYTNKLLQTEHLTNREKSRIVEQLDAAKTVREVKLVYDSTTKAISGSTRKNLSEGRDRQVLGSSSRPTRSAAVTLNEGYETDRWAKLAGITK